MDLLTDQWSVEFHSGIPVYRQIINHIQGAIASGRLREGDQLPAIRALHQKLDVNPNTVAKAYRELELRSVIVVEHGSGCFVAPPPKMAPLTVKEKKVKMGELLARFTAEAKGHGIHPDEIIQFIKQKKSYG